MPWQPILAMVIALGLVGTIYFFVLKSAVDTRRKYDEAYRFRVLHTAASRVQDRLHHIPSIVEAASAGLSPPSEDVAGQHLAENVYQLGTASLAKDSCDDGEAVSNGRSGHSREESNLDQQIRWKGELTAPQESRVERALLEASVALWEADEEGASSFRGLSLDGAPQDPRFGRLVREIRPLEVERSHVDQWRAILQFANAYQQSCTGATLEILKRDRSNSFSTPGGTPKGKPATCLPAPHLIRSEETTEKEPKPPTVLICNEGTTEKEPKPPTVPRECGELRDSVELHLAAALWKSPRAKVWGHPGDSNETPIAAQPTSCKPEELVENSTEECETDNPASLAKVNECKEVASAVAECLKETAAQIEVNRAHATMCQDPKDGKGEWNPLWSEDKWDQLWLEKTFQKGPRTLSGRDLPGLAEWASDLLIQRDAPKKWTSRRFGALCAAGDAFPANAADLSSTPNGYTLTIGNVDCRNAARWDFSTGYQPDSATTVQPHYPGAVLPRDTRPDGSLYSAPSYSSRIPLASLLDDLTPLEFGTLLVIDPAGRVVHQVGADVGIVHLSELNLNGEGIPLDELVDRANRYGAGQGEAVLDVYIQPLDLSFLGSTETGRPASEASRNGSATSKREDGATSAANAQAPTSASSTWMLAGVVHENSPVSTGSALHRPAAIAFGLILLSLIVLSPFARLMLLPARTSIGLGDVVLLGASLVLMSGILTITYLYSSAELYQEEQVHRHLDGVGPRVAGALRVELEKSSSLLDDWIDIYISKWGSSESIKKDESGMEFSSGLEELFVVDSVGVELEQSKKWRDLNHNASAWQGTLRTGFRPYFNDAISGRGITLAVSDDESEGGNRYAVQRVDSVGSGVRSTAIARRVPCPSLSTNKDQAGGSDASGTDRASQPQCVAAVLRRLESLVEAVHWEPIGFAIVERSGRVLIHSDDERSLEENFIVEADDDQALGHMIRTGKAGRLTGRYRGRPHTFDIRPVEAELGLPWMVIAFADESLLNAYTSEVVWVSLIVLICYAGYLALLSGGMALTFRELRQPWLWPRAPRVRRAVLAMAIVAAIAIIEFASHYSPHTLVVLLLLPIVVTSVLFRFLHHGVRDKRLDIGFRLILLGVGAGGALLHLLHLGSLIRNPLVSAPHIVWELAGIGLLVSLGILGWVPDETEQVFESNPVRPTLERWQFRVAGVMVLSVVAVIPAVAIYTDATHLYMQMITRHSQRSIADQLVASWSSHVEDELRRSGSDANTKAHTTPAELAREGEWRRWLVQGFSTLSRPKCDPLSCGQGEMQWAGIDVGFVDDAWNERQSDYDHCSPGAPILEEHVDQEDRDPGPCGSYASVLEERNAGFMSPFLGQLIPRLLPVYSESSLKLRVAETHSVREGEEANVEFLWPETGLERKGVSHFLPLRSYIGNVISIVRYPTLNEPIRLRGPLEEPIFAAVTASSWVMAIPLIVAIYVLLYLINSLGRRVFMVGTMLPRLGSSPMDVDGERMAPIVVFTGTHRDLDRRWKIDIKDGRLAGFDPLTEPSLGWDTSYRLSHDENAKGAALRLDERRLSDEQYRKAVLETIETLVLELGKSILLYCSFDPEVWLRAHIEGEGFTGNEARPRLKNDEARRWTALELYTQRIDSRCPAGVSAEREMRGDPRLEELLGKDVTPEQIVALAREFPTLRPNGVVGQVESDIKNGVSVVNLILSRWRYLRKDRQECLERIAKRDALEISDLDLLDGLYDGGFIEVTERLEIKSALFEACVLEKTSEPARSNTSNSGGERSRGPIRRWVDRIDDALPDFMFWRSRVGKDAPSRRELTEELVWAWGIGAKLSKSAIDRLVGLASLDIRPATKALAMLLQPTFREQWALSTPGEQLVLYQLARGRLVDSRNRPVIASLISRGLVRERPFCHIASRAFRRFVLDNADRSRLEQMEKSIKSSAWIFARTILLVVTVFTLFALFGLESNMVSNGILILTSLAGASNMGSVAQIAKSDAVSALNPAKLA